MSIRMIIFVFICLMFSFSCFCAGKLPQGYEDAKWKTQFDKFRQTLFIFPQSMLTSADRKMSSITAVLTDDDKRVNIAYNFYKDRLYQVCVRLKHSGGSPENISNDVINEISEKYGKPVAYHKQYGDQRGRFFQTTWKDDVTRVDFQQFHITKEDGKDNMLCYSSNELMAEINKDYSRGIETKIK